MRATVHETASSGLQIANTTEQPAAENSNAYTPEDLDDAIQNVWVCHEILSGTIRRPSECSY